MKKILVILAIVVIGYFAYSHFMSHGAGGPPQGAPPVSIAEVLQRNVQEWHEFSGRLVAIDQADIRPRVSGTVDQVHFKDGATVKKGDLLFTIDPRPFQAALEAAKARSVLADSELVRAQKLIAEKAIPQRDLDQRKNDAAVAKADLRTAELNLEYTAIRAPIDGRVSRAEITPGNLVESTNAPILTSVVSTSPIYADFEIDETTYMHYADANAVSNSQAVRIPVMMALAGEAKAEHKGHIESFDNRLNNASGTIRVRAVFDNEDGKLVPGLFARVSLGTPDGDNAILITDRAVGTDQSKKFVLVVGDDNKAMYREITLGGEVNGLRIVRSGLKPGDKIIVNGTQRARPGMPVTPEVVPMESGDAPVPAADAAHKQDAS